MVRVAIPIGCSLLIVAALNLLAVLLALSVWGYTAAADRRKRSSSHASARQSEAAAQGMAGQRPGPR